MQSRFVLWSVLAHGALILGAGVYATRGADPRPLRLQVLPPQPAPREVETKPPTPPPAAETTSTEAALERHLPAPPQTFEPPPETLRDRPLPRPLQWTDAMLRPLRPEPEPPTQQPPEKPPEEPPPSPPPAPLVEARIVAGQNPSPHYPRAARDLELEGVVRLRAHIAGDGGVTRVEVLQSSGHALLDQAATEALERWRFEPARRGALPVDSTFDQEFEFRLRG